MIRFAAVTAAVTATLIAGPANADAQTLSDAGTEYFEGEYTSSIGWLSLGAVGVATGTTLLVVSDDEAVRSAGYPLVVFGGLHLAFGAWVGVASRPRAADLRSRFGSAPDVTARAELDRVNGIINTFRV